MLPIINRSGEEAFENTSFEFVWALRQSQRFYHNLYFFNPCLRIFLAWDEYYALGKHC